MQLMQRTGVFLAVVFIIIAIIGIWLSPDSIITPEIHQRFQPPSANFWLGTDQYGRDIFGMLVLGAGNSLLISVCAVLGGGFVGSILAVLIWMLGIKTLHKILNFISHGLMAFPALLVALVLSAYYQPGFITVVTAIAFYNIPVFAKITLAILGQLQRNDYAKAAIALGQGKGGILMKHHLKPLFAILIIQFAVQVSFAILAEAGLSYLGFGINYPYVSWGKMLFDSQTFIYDNPWLVIWPGICISMAILAFQLSAEWLRKKLDIRD